MLRHLGALTVVLAALHGVDSAAGRPHPATPPPACDLGAILAADVEGAEATSLYSKIKERAPTCAPHYARALAEAKVCGSGTEIVASALFSTGEIDPAQVLAKATCDQHLVPAAQETTRVSKELAALLKEKRAWLALGTAGHVARETGNEEVRAFIDETLTRAIGEAKGDQLVSLLEAAGNAGCTRCVSEDAKRSPDARVRRAAVGLLRFDTSEDATRAMCAALGDADTAVRDHAAWALRWSPANAEIRTVCLARAAAEDPAESVRTTAAQSLLELESGREGS